MSSDTSPNVPPVHASRHAGFWIRATADLIDSLVLDLATGMIALVGVGILFWTRLLIFKNPDITGEGPLGLFNAFSVQIALVLIRGGLSIPYYTYSTYFYQATLGKWCLKVYVVSAQDHSRITLKQSFIRCFSYALSYLPFGAGFLMVLFNPQKRALHDLLAKTVCLRGRGSSVSFSVPMSLLFLSALMPFYSLPAATAAESPAVSKGTVFYPQLVGSAQGFSGVAGGDLHATVLYPLNQNRSFLLGPRAGFIGLWGEGNSDATLQLGVEGTLWALNAIGVSLAVNWVPHSDGGEFQIQPTLAVRLAHFKETGAWAIRVGPLYDTLHHWGVQAGLGLQLSGVPITPNVD